MIYLLGGIAFCIQIAAALHVYRTGRNQNWIWVIMIGSMLGVTAYFAFELMPEWFGPGSRYARRQRDRPANLVAALQAAERELAVADTAATQMAVAEVQFSLGAYQTAADHYRRALDRMNGRDPKIEVKLAQALFEASEYREALKIVERLDMPVATGEADRLSYLKARILAELDRRDEAAAIYEDVVTRLSGQEARCRYAALLLEMDRKDEAKAVLDEVAKGLAKMNKADRAVAPEMFAWAEQQRDALKA